MSTNQQDDEAQLVREISRAQQARDVVDNPLYAESFATLREQLRGEWETSPARDTEARERIWLAINLLGKVEQHLKQAMETGQMAKIQLRDKRSRIQQMRDWAVNKWGT